MVIYVKFTLKRLFELNYMYHELGHKPSYSKVLLLSLYIHQKKKWNSMGKYNLVWCEKNYNNVFMRTHNFNYVNIAYQIYLNALKRFISNLKRKIIRIEHF